MSDDKQTSDCGDNCPSKQRDRYDKINTAVGRRINRFDRYTTFAGFQSCEMVKATNAASASVRAWVLPAGIAPPAVD
jgi:hypothetical protein